MDSDAAVFAHHKQLHWSGKNYNKNNAIPRYEKNWNHRNSFWSWRHASACYNVQFLGSFFQCGGLALEIMHGNFKRWFWSWMKRDTMGFQKAVGWQYLLPLKANYTRMRNITEKYIKERNCEWPIDWINELHRHYDNTTGLVDLKNDILKAENNYHAYLHFDNIDVSCRSYTPGMYLD